MEGLSIAAVHISVCVCTFRRPRMLTRLLEGVAAQKTGGLFTYDVVVVDNDSYGSARAAVEAFGEKSDLDVRYFVEPVQNISQARNMAMANARGRFIAFMDDDENPVGDWLMLLYTAIQDHNADGALGPVKPHFEDTPPSWLVKSGFCDRPSFPTGTFLGYDQTRTGNVMFKKEIVQNESFWFDPAFGRTGGEDIEFFKKQIAQGRTFVWCDEAAVYETVPPERWTRGFYLRKYLRIGGLSGEKVRAGTHKIGSFPRSAATLALNTAALPFTIFFGSHVSMIVLSRVLYNFGWIMGYAGRPVLRDRDDLRP